MDKNKLSCSCDEKRKYTGKEPSPKGLGICAHCTPEGVVMQGRDGNLWENKEFRNSKKWFMFREDF